MYSFSNIFVATNTLLEFINNTAAEYGGGIYYLTSDQHDFISGMDCFIQYEGQEEIAKRNVTFIFSGNVARSGGTSIYAESFLNCNRLCDNRPFGNALGNLFSMTPQVIIYRVLVHGLTFMMKRHSIM